MECREKEAPVSDCSAVLYTYAGEARRLISAYKFGSRRELVRYLAGLVARELRSIEYSSGLRLSAVPVPPRPGKIRRTGWDQIEDIARRLEREEGVVVERCLRRVSVHAQKKLDRDERALNARRGYVLQGKAPKACVVFDDVMTTGATLDACARALKAGGSSFVAVVALCGD